MSVPSVDIWCDTCGFKSSSGRVWGRYFYQFEDGLELPLNRIAGWCYDCENIESVEDFKSIDNIERDIETKSEALNKMKKSFGFKLMGRNKDKYQDIKKEISENQLLLSLLKQRKSPEKCLSCGSTNLSPLELPSPEEDQTVVMPFNHPNCGGYLFARQSPVRLNLRLPKLIYDLEGNFIKKER